MQVRTRTDPAAGSPEITPPPRRPPSGPTDPSPTPRDSRHRHTVRHRTDLAFLTKSTELRRAPHSTLIPTDPSPTRRVSRHRPAVRHRTDLPSFTEKQTPDTPHPSSLGTPIFIDTTPSSTSAPHAIPHKPIRQTTALLAAPAPGAPPPPAPSIPNFGPRATSCQPPTTPPVPRHRHQPTNSHPRPGTRPNRPRDPRRQPTTDHRPPRAQTRAQA